MRLLFATDGSRGARAAQDFLLSLPLSSADDVTLVSIPVASERETLAVLNEARWRFASRNIPATTVLRRGHAADVVRDVALERASELIVVGSRGLGAIGGVLMGSVARALARQPLAPVLVVRARRDAPRQVVLAVDGSQEGRAAVDLVVHLPLPSESRLSLLQVVAEGDERDGLAVIERARVLLNDRISDEDIIDRGHIGEQLLHRALELGSDLIVLGARDQSHGTGLLNTSIADHVLSHAHCAVLVARSRFATQDARRPVRVPALVAV